MFPNLKKLILNVINFNGSKADTVSEIVTGKPNAKRKNLTREDVVQLIEANGGSWGLDLSGVDLSNIDLSGMDLRGINFSKATLDRANLSNAFLERINFQEASCWRTNMSGSSLWSADFRGAELDRCDLRGAYLQRAKLQEASLDKALLEGADIHRAYFSETLLDRKSLGENGILHENGEHFRAYVFQMELFQQGFRGNPRSDKHLSKRIYARFSGGEGIYRKLKNNFEQLGFYGDASWAYKRERRMRKCATRRQAGSAWKKREYKNFLSFSSLWLSDWFVELLCDYGESVSRVILWLLLILFVLGPLLVYFSGGLIWDGSNQEFYANLPNRGLQNLYGYFQGVLYMLDVLTTADYSELAPRNDLVRFVSGLMAMLGIALIGLLGFVVGNRIRNS